MEAHEEIKARAEVARRAFSTTTEGRKMLKTLREAARANTPKLLTLEAAEEE
tara:strand:+ start:530 stop:685 length:156 start_codon:yes stop_codon:yes gene_type:complete